MSAASSTPAKALNVHGTAIALGQAAALIRGPSGAGKSDLALRCITVGALAGFTAQGATLISDDRCVLQPGDANTLMVSAPGTLAGKLEVRGLGIIAVAHQAPTPLRLVVDIVAPSAIARMPEPEHVDLDGIAVPRVALAPFEASAPIKLLIALASVAS
ncbi:MAG: hypothetical protein AAFR04_13440 [Pseudomonadota bacterium]